MVAGGLLVTLGGLSLARPLFATQSLWDQTAPLLTRDMELGTVDFFEPSLVWLFRNRIGGFETGLNWKDAEKWMRQPGARVCVLPESELGRVFGKMDPGWQVVKASGYDVSNGHPANLAAVVKGGVR